ncbi:rna-directed dna polymerase from mobile element jockey-like [Pitangus sulphuratus]|nr:rna-directed dna polymerase from mobile element jockey-like [Pitangus sulphuratus]
MVHLELNRARDVKDNKKGFLKYISSKTKSWENVDLLLNGVGALVTENTEKADLLDAFFASVFTVKAKSHESQILKTRVKVWRKEDFPSVKEDHVRDDTDKLDTHKSIRPNGMHIAVLSDARGSWQMLLLRCSPSSLKGHGEQEGCLRTR